MLITEIVCQDQGAMMFGGQGTETTQVSIPNNVCTHCVAVSVLSTFLVNVFVAMQDSFMVLKPTANDPSFLQL